MTGSDTNLNDLNQNRHKSNRLNIQLTRNATTVPSTPLVPTFKTDKGPGHHSGDRDSGSRSSKLGKIKSLGKIDIRSPIITHTVTPQHSQIFGDNVSLYTSRTHNTMTSKLLNLVPETLYSMRNYYNDFTTIDWADAFMKTNRFQYELHHKHWLMDEKLSQDEDTRVKIPLYYRYYLRLGNWLLIVLIGFVFSLVAFMIDKLEIMLVGFKHGYCTTNWFASQVSCCANNGYSTKVSPIQPNIFKSGFRIKDEDICPEWISWSTYFQYNPLHNNFRFDFLIYVVLTIVLAVVACLITLSTKISGRYPVQSGEKPHKKPFEFDEEGSDSSGLPNGPGSTRENPPLDNLNSDDEFIEEDDTSDGITYVEGKTMYTAAGSGVPEVKTILSGFVIRRFLGTYTFFAKTIALILAIASGMSLGKEGPYVHLAAAVGNILSRFFLHVSNNELIQKQVLSAAALSGVALAFGSPLGGVLFILEEINHSLPSHQLFQIFFCAIISTLFLKFLDPYGTGNTVLFELDYKSDWNAVELLFFILIGVAGGVFGALFVKFVGWWPKKFRQLKPIKDHPIFEVTLIALITGIVTFWNPYTKQASTELVLDLATPCTAHEMDRSLCPSNDEEFTRELGSLFSALVIKIVLTSITFGLKLPIGIYVPSMVIGALFGRFFAMFIEWLNYNYNLNLSHDLSLADPGNMASIMRIVCDNGKDCIDLGIYSMISAGAFMAGVTRMNITLVTILFEITSSYTYVLPISISIAVANWMGNIIESNSLYESLLIANDYPFMPPETEPIDPFKTAGEIVEELVKVEPKESSLAPPLQQPNFPLLLIPTSPLAHTNPPSGLLSHSRPQMSRNNTFLQQNPSQATTGQNRLSQIIDNDASEKLYIDLTNSPYVPISLLKTKLLLLANKQLLDGCIALLKHNTCIGIIFFPELEFCVDKIDEFCIQYEIEDDIYCKLNEEDDYFNHVNVELLRAPFNHNMQLIQHSLGDNLNLNAEPEDYFNFNYGAIDDEETTRLVFDLQQELLDLSTLINYINFNPIFLNYNSELSLANLVFDKIGNRVIVLLKNGQYYGVLHKKTLVDYIRREN